MMNNDIFNCSKSMTYKHSNKTHKINVVYSYNLYSKSIDIKKYYIFGI